MSAVVEVAWATAPGEYPAEDDWVAVTDDVVVDGESVAVTARSGRSSAALDGLTPGSLDLALESPGGRYNPRNSESPHAGQLRRGVPIRVRTVTPADGGSLAWPLYGLFLHGGPIVGGEGGIVSTDRWTGAVAVDWDQTLTAAGTPVVSVEGHDILGVLAGITMPATAFAAELNGRRPTAWWQPTRDGWRDEITGARARTSGALVEVDPLIDGDDKSWASPLPGSVGVVEVHQIDTDAVAESLFWSCWVRLNIPPFGEEPVVFRQLDVDGAETFSVRIAVGATYVTWANGDGSTTWRGVASPLQYVAQHLAVSIDPAEPMARLWLDGREVTLEEVDTGDPTGAPERFEIGSLATEGPLDAAIDHVTWWIDSDGLDPEAWARTLFTAGRLAWVGDTLDQRLARIVTAAGWGAWLGDLDTSAVVTQVGYRGGGTALAMLETIEQTEQGRIWCGPDGRIRFSAGRWATTDPTAVVAQAVFSDRPDLLDDEETPALEMTDDGTTIGSGPRDLVTSASVTSEFGREQTVFATPEVFAQWGPRESVRLSGLLHGSDRRSRTIAEWIVASRSRGEPYVDELTFDPSASGAHRYLARRVTEGWAIDVAVAADTDCAGTAVGDPTDIAGHVAGASWQWSAHQERVSLQIDPTRRIPNPFLLDNSDLDGTDVLVF